MPTLRDLGLSEYESRVYRALLGTGPTTAKELSRSSGVPMGRIYDVLGDLETAELVHSQPASRPKKYAAVEPETALNRLLEDRRREVEAELDRYEEAVEALTDRLEASEPAEGQFYTVGIGVDESVALLIERLAAATDRIEMVIDDLSPQLDVERVGPEIADEIEAALDRGVAVHALVAPAVIEASPRSLTTRYAELTEREHYDLRVAEGLAGTFNLVDRAEVCMSIPNPLDPAEPLALIALRDPAFAANLHEELQPVWERAASWGLASLEEPAGLVED